MSGHLLTIITFLPLAGAFLLLAMNRERTLAIKRAALAVSFGTFALSLKLVFAFSPSLSQMQLEERSAWIPALNISYHLGIDGISLLLVLLTTFICPLAILSSWTSIDRRIKQYFIFMLLLETGMIGVFVALDFFLFYVFWESMLIPMVFLIGIWGGENRIYAAVKFFLYTMAGSVLMLVGILTLYFRNGSQTFDFTEILANLQTGSLVLSCTEQFWLFLAFFVAFAIKVPMFPFHTWLPDAHVEAPTAGSVLLAGVLLKMGAYGILRFCLPLFPLAARQLALWISILAVIGIIYGALVAMVQPDMKKLVAYSSVSHLGFVVLGIFAFNLQGMEGAIYQMLNHGISTGALFLLVGMIYERRHTRQIEDFGGLATPLPVYAFFFMVITLSSIGLPLLNGFVGEFLILLGSFKANIALTALAASGVILSAVYLLWMYQRVFWGENVHPQNQQLKDLSGREKLILIPLVVMVLWMGVYSQTFLRKMDASAGQLLRATQITVISAGAK